MEPNFSMVTSDRKRGSGYKLEKKYEIQSEENTLYCEGGKKNRNKLPEEVVEPPSSELLKIQLDTVLGNDQSHLCRELD